MLPANVLFAYVLDLIFGDPEWFPHPVRLIGKAVSLFDAALRRPVWGRAYNVIAGAVVVVVIVLLSYIITGGAIVFATRHFGRVAGWGATLLVGWSCISARSLGDAAEAVLRPLVNGDTETARTMLARIVGRDTAVLDEADIARGTVAENSSDGIVAPLFYLAVGGPPLAIVYKAINTMDSMLGYRNEKYLWFGKAAARLDDLANLIPARLTGLFVVAASWLLSLMGRWYDPRGSWNVFLRDGKNHTSPNSGYPEAAAAGALGVRLGGENSYFGVKSLKPYIGDTVEPLDAGKVRDAVRLMYATSLVAAVFCAGIAWVVRGVF